MYIQYLPIKKFGECVVVSLLGKIGLLELGWQIVDPPQSIVVLGGDGGEICQGRHASLLECEELSLCVILNDGLWHYRWGSSRKGGFGMRWSDGLEAGAVAVDGDALGKLQTPWRARSSAAAFFLVSNLFPSSFTRSSLSYKSSLKLCLSLAKDISVLWRTSTSS